MRSGIMQETFNKTGFHHAGSAGTHGCISNSMEQRCPQDGPHLGLHGSLPLPRLETLHQHGSEIRICRYPYSTGIDAKICITVDTTIDVFLS